MSFYKVISIFINSSSFSIQTQIGKRSVNAVLRALTWTTNTSAFLLRKIQNTLRTAQLIPVTNCIELPNPCVTYNLENQPLTACYRSIAFFNILCSEL